MEKISQKIKKSLSLEQRENILITAKEKGLPADMLIQLSREEGPDPEDHEKRFVRWATVGTIAMIGGGLLSNLIRPDLNVPELVRQAADLIFSPGNAPVADATLRTIFKQLFQWGVSFGESSLLIGYLLTGIKSRITKSNQLQRLSELQTNLENAIANGEAQIIMPQKYTVAVDLGTGGDAIGNTIIEALECGKEVLPLCEGGCNVSGSPVWVKLPNPSNGIETRQFFEGLDRASFQNAESFILCPLEENQAFLPNLENPLHFDLRVDETMDRISLSDEYCLERKIPQKRIVIICDGNVSRTVGPYVEDTPQPTEKYTLKQIVDKLNEARSEEAKIIVADPTDIVLNKLASSEYNPDRLPLEFFEDVQQEETYGARFIKRCRAMNIPVKTSGDPSEPSLKITYGIDDLATRETTARLNPKNTVAIIIDSIRAVGTPYKSIIVADTVKDWVLTRI